MRNANCHCPCHCHCNHCQYYNINNLQGEKKLPIQQTKNYTINNFGSSTTDQTKFSNKIQNTYFYNPNNTTTILRNSLNGYSPNQKKNINFTRSLNNYITDFLNNESKIKNPKSFSSSKFDKNFFLNGKNNLNNRKTGMLFNSDKCNEFKRNSSFIKNEKLYDLSNDDDRLRQMLRKIPKHEKRIFSKNIIPTLNKYKPIKRNQDLYKTKGIYKTKFNEYVSSGNCIRGYNYKGFNSFVMPPNDFDKVTTTMSNINF